MTVRARRRESRRSVSRNSPRRDIEPLSTKMSDVFKGTRTPHPLLDGGLRFSSSLTYQQAVDLVIYWKYSASAIRGKSSQDHLFQAQPIEKASRAISASCAGSLQQAGYLQELIRAADIRSPSSHPFRHIPISCLASFFNYLFSLRNHFRIIL